jgi:hypothetical protein
MEEKPEKPKPSSEKKVKVKISQGRAIKGVGKAGDVVQMDESVAQQYVRDGFVTIVKEK